MVEVVLQGAAVPNIAVRFFKASSTGETAHGLMPSGVSGCDNH